MHNPTVLCNAGNYSNRHLLRAGNLPVLRSHSCNSVLILDGLNCVAPPDAAQHSFIQDLFKTEGMDRLCPIWRDPYHRLSEAQGRNSAQLIGLQALENSLLQGAAATPLLHIYPSAQLLSSPGSGAPILIQAAGGTAHGRKARQRLIKEKVSTEDAL